MSRSLISLVNFRLALGSTQPCHRSYHSSFMVSTRSRYYSGLNPSGSIAIKKGSSEVKGLTIRNFSCTKRLSIKTKKQKKEIERQRLKEKQMKNQVKANQSLRSKPDPILGYSTLLPNDYLKWQNCELNKLILNNHDVWSGNLNSIDQIDPDRQTHDNQKSPGMDSNPTQSSSKLLLNFGLNENEHQRSILFEGLPNIESIMNLKSDHRSILDNHHHQVQTNTDPDDLSNVQDRLLSNQLSSINDTENEEELKKQRLMRILDLRNSNSQGIDKFNKARILKAFSPADPLSPGKLDPGCSQVQAAVLTYRIHMVLKHAWDNRRDKNSKRHLSDLVMKRMKILKYLRRTNPKEYFNLLPRLGLGPNYLKDELIVRAKLPLRPGESLD